MEEICLLRFEILCKFFWEKFLLEINHQMFMNQPINIVEKSKEIKKPWSPVEILRINDQIVRLALFEGEYHWHKHEKEDELFYVVSGNITIQQKGHPDQQLNEGDMIVINKGIEYKPISKEKSFIMLFEPLSLDSKGD